MAKALTQLPHANPAESARPPRWRWPSLGFELTVAVRFLREGRFQTALIIFGVAAGVAVVAYISALVTGLQRNTLDKTLGAQAHVVVAPADDKVSPVLVREQAADDATVIISDQQARDQRVRTVSNWPAVLSLLERNPAVAAVSPMAAGAALARRGEATKSIAITGVELPRYDQIVDLRSRLTLGDASPLLPAGAHDVEHPGSSGKPRKPLSKDSTVTMPDGSNAHRHRPGLASDLQPLSPGDAIIGTTLAQDFGLRIGDRITLTTGPRTDTVRVVGLVDFGIRDLNRRTVILPLRSAQSLLNLPGGITQLDLKLVDVWSASKVAAELARGLPYKVESWQETNAQLVSALNAQSISTGLIRAVVMVVVVLGIASVLVVSVVQKQREIGILRAMGSTSGQILRVFLLQGAMVGALGSVLGVGMAAGMIKLFTMFVRGSDGLPLFSITLPPAMALQVVAVAMVAGVLAAIAPARRASKMDPALAIRL